MTCTTKVEEISQKQKHIETTMEAMDTRLGEMENGVDFMETNIEGLKGQVKELRTEKADAKDVNDELKKNVVDLVNRSKRNNERVSTGHLASPAYFVTRITLHHLVFYNCPMCFY